MSGRGAADSAGRSALCGLLALALWLGGCGVYAPAEWTPRQLAPAVEETRADDAASEDPVYESLSDEGEEDL